MIQTGFLDSNRLAVAPDGSFELLLSARPHDGNWVPMEPGTNALVVRQTFLDRKAETPAELSIERIDGGPKAVPPVLSAERLQGGLDARGGLRRKHRPNLRLTGPRAMVATSVSALPPGRPGRAGRPAAIPISSTTTRSWALADDEALRWSRWTALPACGVLNFQDQQLLDGIARLPLSRHLLEQAPRPARCQWRCHRHPWRARPGPAQLAGDRRSPQRHHVLALGRRGAARASAHACGQTRIPRETA
ncbi:hypothetical protein ACTMU2_05800 [Cupriavidus basilensis]